MSAALRLHQVGDFALESGQVLRDVAQAYVLHGALSPGRDNLVLVFHALTGTADPAEWWPGIVGPGRALDTSRYAVLGTNLLGSCFGTRWRPGTARPRITTRDQARLVQRLVETLEVESVALAVGGSLGGMVAMEWAAHHPASVRAAVVLAAPAAHAAQAIGWNHVQRRIVAAAGEAGLEIARALAVLTYRTPAELEDRFGRRGDGAGWVVGRYLDHQGRKLRARFSDEAYLALTAAMDSHDVGRGRGGVAGALRPIADRLVGVGIPGDLLYPAGEVRAWTGAAGAAYREVESRRGHDGFLLEIEQVGHILADALHAAATAATAGAS
jgi:homoserine O-acetyltransferase/O-succinyltransferase